ncbi:MAG: phosphoribosylamine--glycine ligase [Xanthomonadales bacterium]|jgi:phosphoribosylamine--glycine ligase|nr:phosphoribosylamine--glycine ligase [Xanthomonadales bacterium]
MDRFPVLVIGQGGREHAIAWQLLKSPQVSAVHVAPGNAGTAREPGMVNVPIAVTDVQALADYAVAQGIGLSVVGPEVPLAAGVVDHFQSRDLAIFGPTRAAAELESSKAYAKDFLARHRIPTAAYAVHERLDDALADVRRRGAPIVVKADGLAAGKGVVVAMTLAEAEAALADIFGGSLGSAGARVVVEDFLDGEEASYIVIARGLDYVPFASAQDHKRLLDGDAGPNTGGMGAYSPAPVVTPEIEARIRREIIEPTLAGMIAEGRPFTGFLYAGVMVGRDGTPRVLEFNTRLGDPETQPLLFRLKSDFCTVLQAAVRGEPLPALDWDPRPALAVVLAAEGYPGTVRRGDAIEGLDADADDADAKIFHAGTRLDGDTVYTDGGRVLAVTALGEDLAAAQARAYAVADRVGWAGRQCRRDIGWRALRR